MRRREFIKRSGSLLLGGPVLSLPLLAREVRSASTSVIDELIAALGESDGSVFTRANQDDYRKLTRFYNKRFDCLNPDVLVYCRSPRGVAMAVQWCRANRIRFSIRSGGHCYEGLSRSGQAIIDVRGLNGINFKPKEGRLHAGSGVNLGQLYRTVAAADQAIPAGTCPTVGIAGHAVAGGIGFLVRQFGLAIDSVRSIELVNATGSVMSADESTNGDLFWALRGAGAGSFGIVTKLTFETYQVPRVNIYEQQAVLPKAQAAQFMANWQSWIFGASSAVSSVVFAKKQRSSGRVLIEVKGLDLGTRSGAEKRLDLALTGMGATARRMLRSASFRQAFQWFSAGEDFPPTYEKGKSDIIKRPLMRSDWRLLFDELTPDIDVEIHGLGGRMAEIGWDQTAFPHRGDASLLVQWGIAWERVEQEKSRLQEIDAFYRTVRPLMSSAAFLSYADRDIPNPADAYWGTNLPRLVEVKRRYDPENVFRHALSVPLQSDNSGSSEQKPTCT